MAADPTRSAATPSRCVMTASHKRRACDNGGACYCIDHPEEVARINGSAAQGHYEDPGVDITEPSEPLDPDTVERLREEHGIELPDWKPTRSAAKDRRATRRESGDARARAAHRCAGMDEWRDHFKGRRESWTASKDKPRGPNGERRRASHLGLNSTTPPAFRDVLLDMARSAARVTSEERTTA